MINFFEKMDLSGKKWILLIGLLLVAMAGLWFYLYKAKKPEYRRPETYVITGADQAYFEISGNTTSLAQINDQIQITVKLAASANQEMDAAVVVVEWDESQLEFVDAQGLMKNVNGGNAAFNASFINGDTGRLVMAHSVPAGMPVMKNTSIAPVDFALLTLKAKVNLPQTTINLSNVAGDPVIHFVGKPDNSNLINQALADPTKQSVTLGLPASASPSGAGGVSPSPSPSGGACYTCPLLTSNLLSNGGFESGKIGWEDPVWADANAPLLSSGGCCGNFLKLTTKNTDGTLVKDYIRKSQWINISPGTLYTLSACGKRDGNAHSFVIAEDYSAANASLGGHLLEFTTNNWECKSVSFTTASATSKLAVSIFVGDDNVPGGDDPNLEPATDFYADNIIVKAGGVSPSPSPSVSVSPSPSAGNASPSPSASPAVGSGVTLNLKVKFDGVPANDNDMNLPSDSRTKDITTTIAKASDGTVVFNSTSTNYGYDTDDKTWNTFLGLTSAQIGNGGQFIFKLKGPSQRRILFCRNGQGTEVCSRDTKITLNLGNTYDLNFTGHPLEFGDVDGENGVTVNDYSIVKTCKQLNATKGDENYDDNGCKYADGNFDGVVDNTDMDLLLKTISNKPDDE